MALRTVAVALGTALLPRENLSFSCRPDLQRQKGASKMKRTATAIWNGTLKEGNGKLSTLSGAISDLPYTHKGRFVDETGQSGTNPEELIAAAHAGCFSQQLAAFLAENGTPAAEINTTAEVELIPGTGIVGSALKLEAKVPGIDKARFDELAQKAKAECPVSGALRAINITLDAKLVS
jgi:lipoyl-dependent peroxiredoxin